MGDESIHTGVSLFAGVFGTTWYGWAKKGKLYREGGARHLKVLARFDAWRLGRKI